MFRIKELLIQMQNHKPEIIKILEKYTIQSDGDCHENIVIDSLSTDSSCTSVNKTASSRDGLLLFGIVLGRGGGGGPGDSSGWRFQGVAWSIIQKVYNSLLHIFDVGEHGFISYLLCLSDPLFSFLNNNSDWIIPIPVLYLIYEYFEWISTVYKIDLQFQVPSHRAYVTIFNNFWDRKPGIKTLKNFLRPEKGTRFIKDLEAPFCQYTNYTEYKNFIDTYHRLHLLKEKLGLVSVNRFNLVLDTVHNTFAGVGLKGLNGEQYTSTLVQTITKAYSRLHRRYRYGLFNILVTGGIGVVVWYKFVLDTGVPAHIPEAIASFQNPTAVVEGYERVTFWMTQDVQEIVKHTFKHEPPFNEIDLPTIEDSKIMKDAPAYIGLAIMLATFITTKVLIPLSTNVVIPT